MAALVVDASSIAAVTFGEPEAKQVEGVVRGREIASSSLFWHELTNIARNKQRSHPAQTAAIRAAFAAGLALEISVREVDRLAVLDLAIEQGLTAYDASYLWLALRLGGGLATLDRELRAAYERVV